MAMDEKTRVRIKTNIESRYNSWYLVFMTAGAYYFGVGVSLSLFGCWKLRNIVRFLGFLNWKTYENILFISYKLYWSLESYNPTRNLTRSNSQTNVASALCGQVRFSYVNISSFCHVPLFHNVLVFFLLPITGNSTAFKRIFSGTGRMVEAGHQQLLLDSLVTASCF